MKPENARKIAIAKDLEACPNRDNGKPHLYNWSGVDENNIKCKYCDKDLPQ